MISKDKTFYLGMIKRTHALKGAVCIHLDAYDSALYTNLESVFLSIDGLLVPFFIENLQLLSNHVLLVRFYDHQSKEQAETLVGKEVYLPLEQLPDLNENKNQFYCHEIIGYRAVNQIEEELGLIESIIESKSQKLLCVKNQENKEILIPLVDVFIQKINHKEKKLTFLLPEGFLSLF